MCVNSFVFTSCANFLATFFHFLSNRIEYYLQRAESAKYHEWMCNLGCLNLNNVQKRYNQNTKLFIESRIHPPTKFRFLTLPSSVTNFYSYQYQLTQKTRLYSFYLVDYISSVCKTTLEINVLFIKNCKISQIHSFRVDIVESYPQRELKIYLFLKKCGQQR